jgi:hypothetical protein
VRLGEPVGGNGQCDHVDAFLAQGIHLVAR